MKKFDPVACCTHIELDTTRWPGSLPAPCGNLIKKAIEDSEHDYDVQKRKPRQRQGWINMKHMRFMHTPITSATCFVLFCCSVTELFTDLCLSAGFTIRENPPRAFLCVCVSLFFVPSITSSRRGREREKSNAMSHSVLEREREGGRVGGWVGEYLSISYKEAAVRRHMPYGQNWLSTHGWVWQACGWEPPLNVCGCVCVLVTSYWTLCSMYWQLFVKNKWNRIGIIYHSRKLQHVHTHTMWKS